MSFAIVSDAASLAACKRFEESPRTRGRYLHINPQRGSPVQHAKSLDPRGAQSTTAQWKPMPDELAEPLRAAELFRRFVTIRGIRLDDITPNIAVDAMLGFFGDQRFSLAIGDNDWLPFQYGSYKWGDEARHFEFDLTRQFALDDSEPEDATAERFEGGIWQLSLTLKFQPRPDLEALGRDEHWCTDSRPEAIAHSRI